MSNNTNTNVSAANAAFEPAFAAASPLPHFSAIFANEDSAKQFVDFAVHNHCNIRKEVKLEISKPVSTPLSNFKVTIIAKEMLNKLAFMPIYKSAYDDFGALKADF